jgi:periplasmic protein CpxP/Spy
MKFSSSTAPRLALLLGVASASALGLTGWSGGAAAQTAAAPATSVPPAATPPVPPAATTNAAPPEVPAQGSQKPTSANRPSRGINAYLAVLHDELAITPAEETLWTGFADTLRESAGKLADAYRQRRDQLPGMNAIADMNSFIALEQLRLDGLKAASTAFQALYQTMPPAQQKVADTVFLSDMPGAPHRKKPKTDK